VSQEGYQGTFVVVVATVVDGGVVVDVDVEAVVLVVVDVSVVSAVVGVDSVLTVVVVRSLATEVLLGGAVGYGLTTTTIDGGGAAEVAGPAIVVGAVGAVGVDVVGSPGMVDEGSVEVGIFAAVSSSFRASSLMRVFRSLASATATSRLSRSLEIRSDERMFR
jgi:hypothetical protein